MNIDKIEEMKAKVADRVPMTFTPEETSELLALLEPQAEPAIVGRPLLPVEASTFFDKEMFSTSGSVGEVGSVAMVDVPHEEQKGKLPASFPGHAALAGAGINTFHQARKQRDSEDGLTGVPGIGDATAKLIEAELG